MSTQYVIKVDFIKGCTLFNVEEIRIFFFLKKSIV